MSTPPPPPAAPATFTTVVQRREPNIIIRFLWFIFVGWWLSQLTILVGWLLNITVIGIPVGIALLNRIPQVATLKLSPIQQTYATTPSGTVVVTSASAPAQLPFILRTTWFVLVGWWAAGIWLELAWLLCLTIILIPLGFWMFGAVGKVLTLKR